MKILALGAGLCLLLCGCEGRNGTVLQDNTTRSSTVVRDTTVRDDTVTRDNTVNRDNTAVNKRDADGGKVTPLDQSNSQPDIDQVADIRSQVLKLTDLSVNGRNVKIITDGGKVVLRGPVASAEERERIAAVAKRIAGDGNVDDQLEVAP